MAVAGIAAAAVWLTRPLKQTPEHALVVTPITSYPGSESSPTFSPDASQVAFTWNGEKRDNWDIYVKLADAGTPLRLTTDPASDSDPAWSPDGRLIAFLRGTAGGKRGVMLVPALGGTERKLAELSTADVFGRPLCWTTESKNLIVVDRRAPGAPSGLFILSTETGEKRPDSAAADFDRRQRTCYLSGRQGGRVRPIDQLHRPRPLLARPFPRSATGAGTATTDF